MDGKTLGHRQELAARSYECAGKVSCGVDDARTSRTQQGIGHARVTDSVRALKIASWTAVGCSVMGLLMPVEVDHEAAGSA
jgi:hypothetical protein